MRTILFITALFMSTLLSAQKPVEIPLWPNGAPNTNGLTGDQEDLNGGRVANVVNPTITLYLPLIHISRSPRLNVILTS